MKILIVLSVVLFALIESHFHANRTPIRQDKKAVIALQPLDTFDSMVVKNVRKSISEFWDKKVIVLPVQTLPKSTYMPAVDAYCSDSILSFLSDIDHRNISNLVGITHKNIYTINRVEGTVGGFINPGIFGNSYLPGDCSVVSDYKLGDITKQEYNYALCNAIIHEMGHNYGLSHCPNPLCIMSEKNGSKIGLIKGQLVFCDLCKSKLNYNADN